MKTVRAIQGHLSAIHWVNVSFPCINTPSLPQHLKPSQGWTLAEKKYAISLDMDIYD